MEGSFSKASVPKRIAIVIAGGMVNIIFGILLFFILASVVQNSVYYGFLSTVRFSTSILESLKMLFTGNVSVNELTGPIGISSMVARTQGIDEFVYLLAVISLSLGVTNLLPFPPLDGGKAVIYIIEAIRKKPMKEQTEINIQMIGFALLIGLTIFVAYNDILRIQ
jgi:regulator of sigma E protease